MITSRKRDGTSTHIQQYTIFPAPSQEPDHKTGNPFQRRIQSFLGTSSFSPEFLPSILRCRGIGYIIAIMLPLITLFFEYILKDISPYFTFASAPIMLIIVVVSLCWGAIPGLISTIISTIILVAMVLPAYAPTTLDHDAYLYSTTMLGLTGIGLCLLSTRLQHARLQALQAQKEGENARANLFRVLMQAPIPISVVDGKEFRFVLVNPYAQCFTSGRAQLGQTIYESVPEFAEQITYMLKRVQETGIEQSISEKRILLNCGQGEAPIEKFANVVHQPMFSANGEIDGIIIIATDVTKQVQDRQKIEGLLSELDNCVSVVAHELRTPITAAKTSTQLSQRRMRRILDIPHSIEPEDWTKVLASIMKNLERTGQQLEMQNRLVHDLLDASRVRADSLALQPKRYDLLPDITESIEVQRSLNPGRVINLNHSQATNMVIEADPDRVQQVVINYLTNALKYSDLEKPVNIEVSTREHEIYVAVHDKGPGLKPEQQQRVWERFYRAPGIHVLSGSGMSLGLGLFICRSIIERQGGRVGVESTPGHGSSFWFTLPLVDIGIGPSAPLSHVDGSEERSKTHALITS
ncbi:PAS domain-containing sensor histidine kinase [Ktedonospora formicarum]|uniref:histidine kinase n=1 Tax=Ktedonospora formicarum TaxID=2778364 RepID=A0A8J3HZI5_9CHLR|nr:PAS domain-containing sensor histidine kinase [Ktedonospora formicarum]GHO46604.1 hypothetical protein KSX_47670 [Ktedonospora formicarum]